MRGTNWNVIILHFTPSSNSSHLICLMITIITAFDAMMIMEPLYTATGNVLPNLALVLLFSHEDKEEYGRFHGSDQEVM